MVVSSRTPDGLPNRCPVCESPFRLEPSIPPGDAPCPRCGSLVWFPASNRSEEDDRTVVVVNAGFLFGSAERSTDASELPDLFSKTETILRSCAVLILDFGRVSSLSSTWIGFLVLLHKKLEQSQKRLMLVVPKRNPAVAEVFKVSRLDKVWRIYEDVETALQDAT